MNVVPTRPAEDYEPHKYLDRVPRHFLKLGPARVRGLLIVCWRQGIKRSTPVAVWHHLLHILWANPKVAEQHLAVCAHNEHLMEYRDILRLQIENQLAAHHHQQTRKPEAELVAAP